MTKSQWIDGAEVFDSWRVVPRIALFAFLALLIWASVYIIVWYAHLPAAERTTQVTAFVSVMFPTLVGAGGFIFKVYTDGGRDWDVGKRRGEDEPSNVSASVAVSTS